MDGAREHRQQSTSFVIGTFSEPCQFAIYVTISKYGCALFQGCCVVIHLVDQITWGGGGALLRGWALKFLGLEDLCLPNLLGPSDMHPQPSKRHVLEGLAKNNCPESHVRLGATSKWEE
jgi:hypothetical protein